MATATSTPQRITEGVILPADLHGKYPVTSELPDSLLVPFMDKWRVHHQAFDNFTAFVEAAKRQLNFDLVPIPGSSSAYRSYDQQVRLFTERYVKGGSAKRKTWNGVSYGLRPGMAMAATPGRSMHGLGLAIDFMHINGAAINLKERAALRPVGAPFSVVDTVKSENWHWVVQNAASVVGFEPTAPELPKREPNPTAGEFRTVRRGDVGPDVAHLQTVLREKCAQDTVATDGRFGAKTEAAVRQFQQFFGLPVTGEVGPETWAHLAMVERGG